jgi:two-component system LytT family sensor kinase
MESNFNKEQQYLRAKKQVDKLKGFYANALSYCIVIPSLIFINLRFVPEFYWFWFPMFGWGMGLAFHAMDAYNYNPFLGKNWEENKIKEMMEEEEKYKRYK